jgi:hypothetical protein
MGGILDKSLVSLALLAAAGYAVYSLGPRNLRRRWAAGLAALAKRAPHSFGLRRGLTRLAGAAAGKTAGSCGGCEGCGDDQPAANAQSAGPGGEIRVPLEKIGRRG